MNEEDEKKYIEGLEEFEKDLMPRRFTDPKSLILKYGSNINHDYVFIILTTAILMKHEENTYINKLYDDELCPVLDKIRELKKTKYGLNDDEYFTTDETPDDIKELSNKFDKILDEKLIQLFRKYGLTEFAESYSKDDDKFMTRYYEVKDRLKKKKGTTIISIVRSLEEESERCAKIQAFNAAAILMASAIEGVLYYACSGNAAFIAELIEFNKNKKNREKSTVELNFSELVKLANKAGLLPTQTVPEIGVLLKIANGIRNLIHPGRRLSADYHQVGEVEYSFLYGVFMGLKKTYSLK